MPQVASTLTGDVKYTLWQSKSKDAPGGINVPKGHIVIHGGHGVAIRKPDGGLVTARGVITDVTQEQLELLREHPVFKIHQANGHVQIIETARKVEPEKAAKDMAQVEPSSPLTDADFKPGGRAEAPKDMKLTLGKGKSK